ncbi:septal ring lytic transglycosylase RlpA family protein [Croceicoccus sp. F390]|uniref:Endolytic peptidoglycan transglycosylase RlpA n=1 Tax=Croceicoccus esteveae TaxID=3075597 RepID=A0ABU2ZE08_9SPHN|nr:septal ring lytic transglycosylase RlpA family protein [Croceicoccus sp. F390]MDT0574838.1 septal ring lytic transglycosylase RlpA family protein [Croceicoccus sp. F390]
MIRPTGFSTRRPIFARNPWSRTLIRLRSHRVSAAFAIAAMLPATAAIAVPGSDAPGQQVANSRLADPAPGAVTLVPPVLDNTDAPAGAPLATTVQLDTEPATADDSDGDHLGSGVASYYGPGLAGRPTANGEPFDPSELTAAHRTLPFGSKVKVTSRLTGRSVVVRINDRGPFHGERVIDLSTAAAKRIGLARRGKGEVSLALLLG